MKSCIRVGRLVCAAVVLAVAGLPATAPAQPAPSSASASEAERLDRVASFGRNGPSADPAYLEALTALSLFYVNQARYSDAVPVLRRALAASERIHGAAHDVTKEIRATLMLTERFATSR